MRDNLIRYQDTRAWRYEDNIRAKYRVRRTMRRYERDLARIS